MVLLLLFAGCKADDLPAAAPWGASPSQTVIASADGTVLYAAFADEGIVARYDRATDAVSSLAVDGEPTRLTRAGDHILVTLRAERGIGVIEDRGGALVLTEVATTGAEPLGIVANGDGTRVYVALSTQDEVDELDGDLSLLRAFPVAGRPSWLALHPSGDGLYVASAVGGTLSFIDTSAADPAPEAVVFPEFVGAGRDGDLPFARRLTGDLAFSADGTRLAVPGLWVDDQTMPRGNHGEEGSDPAARYAELGLGLSPNNPGVALIDVDAGGRPTADPARVVYAEGYGADDLVVRSYLSTVGFSPDGGNMLGAMEGSNVVIALSTDDDAMTAGEGGFVLSPVTVTSTGDGPRGLAFVGADPWVHTFLDRSVAPLSGGAPVVLADATLDPEVDAGRHLFYAANNPVVVTPAAGIACATCHFEGRNDGLTWPVDSGIRQTPSLAGPVSETGPFTWTAGVATVAEECRITSQERLGGADISDEQLASLAAYVDFTRDVDHPHRGSTAPEVARGAANFEEAGCAGCHAGERFTDGAVHDLFDLTGVDTPSLVGVEATAPYLHDGRAATLRDVLDLTRTGAMGDTSGLSEAEIDDLEAYLRSL